jgi:uncharacterized membrane protein YphA (DoxX/SURF4 family)
MIQTASRYASALGVIRILTGAWWLIHGYGKLSNPQWGGPSGMCASIIQDMAKGSSGAYHDFLVGFVLSHIATFATLVAWGETLSGVSLLLGLLTVVGGTVSVFLVLNYWIAGSGYSELRGYSGLETAMMILGLVNVLLPTGAVYGLDGLLAKRKKSAA